MMENHTLTTNAACLDQEIAWFQHLVELRISHYLGQKQEAGEALLELQPPELPEKDVPYSHAVRRLGLEPAERLLLILSLLPHIRPDVLDTFFIRNQTLDRPFCEFGGLVGLSHGGFLPTGETAMFLLAGGDVAERLRYLPLFKYDHVLYRHQVLQLDHRHPHEPLLSAALVLTHEYRELLTTGRAYRPAYSVEFPAQRITTDLSWHDLVLNRPTREEVEDLVTWVRHEQTLLNEWRLKTRLKRGFRSLFYGPPGTGKTLTACLLGQATAAPVYRVDLSKVVSKYIGETEKNLAGLFDRAEHRDWILFFDEADSLFGQRTESRSANDRAANQQVSYLLQRIEDFPGLVILATNQRSRLDEAFARRFQSMIHFGLPDFEQRLRLWKDNFENKPFSLADDVDLPRLAREHKLSGGSIINVLRYACLKAVVREPHEIREQDLLAGIRKELHKEGKHFSRLG